MSCCFDNFKNGGQKIDRWQSGSSRLSDQNKRYTVVEKDKNNTLTKQTDILRRLIMLGIGIIGGYLVFQLIKIDDKTALIFVSGLFILLLVGLKNKENKEKFLNQIGGEGEPVREISSLWAIDDAWMIVVISIVLFSLFVSAFFTAKGSMFSSDDYPHQTSTQQDPRFVELMSIDEKYSEMNLPFLSPRNRKGSRSSRR